MTAHPYVLKFCTTGRLATGYWAGPELGSQGSEPLSSGGTQQEGLEFVLLPCPASHIRFPMLKARGRVYCAWCARRGVSLQATLELLCECREGGGGGLRKQRSWYWLPTLEPFGPFAWKFCAAQWRLGEQTQGQSVPLAPRGGWCSETWGPWRCANSEILSVHRRW